MEVMWKHCARAAWGRVGLLPRTTGRTPEQGFTWKMRRDGHWAHTFCNFQVSWMVPHFDCWMLVGPSIPTILSLFRERRNCTCVRVLDGVQSIENTIPSLWQHDAGHRKRKKCERTTRARHAHVAENCTTTVACHSSMDRMSANHQSCHTCIACK